ncbi:MAG: hypothetical protein MHM6MM_000430 [Cercozoa sp. M6MM]
MDSIASASSHTRRSFAFDLLLQARRAQEHGIWSLSKVRHGDKVCDLRSKEICEKSWLPTLERSKRNCKARTGKINPPMRSQIISATVKACDFVNTHQRGAERRGCLGCRRLVRRRVRAGP